MELFLEKKKPSEDGFQVSQHPREEEKVAGSRG